jgi:dipeptidyl aminopeptidase/acylaminoacyl peptidase
MRTTLALVRTTIPTLLLTAGLWFIDPNAIAQSKPISLAYQVTYVDNATPTFSPDGKRMIFESVTDGKEQLYAMDMATLNSVQLTRGPNGHEDPAWSPNGKNVALVSDEGGVQVIYMMNPDGTDAATNRRALACHPPELVAR